MKETQENIYIDALEYGVRNLKKGISYTDLENYLKEKDYNIEGEFAKYFKTWFYSTFFNDPQTKNAIRALSGDTSISGWLDKSPYDEDKSPLMAEGYFNLMDYKELEEARESSRKAHKTAIWAIFIAGLLAFISIVFQFYSFAFQFITGFFIK
ncbi:MAG: hypothetical protein KAX05_11950 [Bacteroidales bacterium]|nr:hypothetical protein [Bacteroidales bacterium]